MRLLCFLLISMGAFAQTVPPAPVMGTVSNPAPSNVAVPTDVAGCGTTTCGLADCSCWIQLYRASCPTATTCPARTTGPPYVTTPGVKMSGTFTGAGTHFVMTDNDIALTAGTIWTYFETANFASYTPFTPSPFSASTGPVKIPGNAAGPVNFTVQLDFDNPQCVTGNNCDAQIYRATCTQLCPQYASSPGSFVQLAGTTTQKVTTGGTHFTFLDTGAAPNYLSYNTQIMYAVTNSYQVNPGYPSGASELGLMTPTGIHSATLNWSSTACRASSECTLQIYRAKCASATSCPAYTPGNTAWKALDMSTGFTMNGVVIGAQGSSWQYMDSDAALTGSTTYVWVATNTYKGATTASPASTPWIGTTAAGKQGKKIILKLNLNKEHK